MKTQLLRVSVAALAVGSLVLCSGCEEKGFKAEVPHFTPAPTGTPVGTAVENKAPAPAVSNPAALAEAAKTPPAPPPAPPTSSANPSVKVVQPPAPPAEMQASPALAEVIKLVQAGVSEDVTLAYINNAPQAFGVSSDQIVYLNDLGVSGTVVTSLIQHDNLPEVAARQANPPPVLPAGFVLSTPATNIYPATYSPDVIPAPGAGEPDSDDPASYATAPLVPPEESVSPASFYDSLSPYGSWMDVEGYGRCWQPTVAVGSPGWCPYSDRGHWVWTDCGWYWYSDYSWGWAPFHYGRWCSYPQVGWFWVPGTCWGPAWVSWRHSSAYCGWAPLPPSAVFVSGHGFYYHGHTVGAGFDFGLGARMYTFVPVGHFTDRSLHNHAVSGNRGVAIFNNTTVVNNYAVQHNGQVVNHGMGVEPVARAAGRKIPPVSIEHSSQLAVAGRLSRHEQFQNNGSSLVVARPPLNISVAPAQPARGSSPAHHLNLGSPGRSVANLAPGAAGPLVTPKSAENGITAVKPAGLTPSPAPPAAPARQPLSAIPPLSRKPYVAPGLRTPPANGTVTANRTGQPGTPSVLTPPLQSPSVARLAPPNRAVNPAPSQAAVSEMYRVYAEPGVAAKPVMPRYDSSAPSYGRPAPVAPMPVRPEYGPPASVAPVRTYHSESTRTPVAHSEPAHTPSAPHAAPAASPSPSRSGGGRKE